MLWRHRALGLVFTLLVISLFNVQATGVVKADGQQVIGRSVTIPIKVILVGFDQNQIVPTDLIAGSAGTPLPASIPAVDFETGNNTGVVYRPAYTFSFAPPNFKSNFESYLKSIAQTKTGNDTWFIQYALTRKILSTSTKTR